MAFNPPENALVWSVDEKSGMQAKSRINPTKPAVPGIPVLREFEYKRHGTAVLVAALDVHDGGVAGWVTDSTRSGNFVEFLGDLVAQTPAGLDLHCIVDNLKTHDTDLVHDFLAEHPRVHLHFTPTHASWLNQVELFFSILERRLLRRGEFDSIEHLAERVIAFIKDYNRKAAPFRWIYDGRPLRAA
jgi:transposase